MGHLYPISRSTTIGRVIHVAHFMWPIEKGQPRKASAANTSTPSAK